MTERGVGRYPHLHRQTMRFLTLHLFARVCFYLFFSSLFYSYPFLLSILRFRRDTAFCVARNSGCLGREEWLSFS